MFGAVARATGLFGLVLASFMMIPMVVDIIDGNRDWQAFLVSAVCVGIMSLMVVLTNWGRTAPYSRRLGFLTVNALWISVAVISAVPYMLAGTHLSFTDALFESVSGLTTTGSTILTGLDSLPRGLLLWRSLTQWLGGVGILAMGLLLFPFLRIGGMQIYRLESSEQSENPVAHFSTFAFDVLLLYVVITFGCTAGYRLAGMTLFDALNHALTTVSTGGFSTHDASMGHFGRSVHLVAIVFMILGALPFASMLRAVLARDLRKADDAQIPALMVVFAIGTVLVFIAGNSTLEDANALGLLIDSAFNIVSVVTTTGFATTDYLGWGPLAVATFAVMTFLGGAAGSTAGGLKTYRLIILLTNFRTMYKELVYPHGVFAMRYNGRALPERAVRAVSMFTVTFVTILLIATIALGATGLDFVTAFSSALTALTNTGPGLGTIIGPVGNFSSLPDAAKWILTFVMLLGRLEIMTMLVVFSPLFWRG